MRPRRYHPLLLCLALWLAGVGARADCTLTNLGITPLNELGLKAYRGSSGGLYPDGSNRRPPAHEAAGLDIATQQIVPRDAAGNVDTNNGKIVLLSLGMSNTTQEWASKGTNTFLRLATNDPSLNPRVRIVDGAIGGQDAVQWTNANAPTWAMVITQRLAQAGVTINQVQVMWLKQALARPRNYGAFPLHAQALQDDLALILGVAKAKYPHLRLVYLSCRTRAYTTNSGELNPEPYALETAFADKWVIQDQIGGSTRLNYNPANGPVAAPWVSWGPYIWTDGLRGRSDGLTSICPTDLESDYTHPSSNGVAKVAAQLLAFFKTDPTTAPWFLRQSIAGQPPVCAPSADVTNGVMPLTVQFTANATAPNGPIHDYQWTFEDGDFSTNANPTRTFPAPGLYHARLTVTDTNGNTAQGSVAINVTATVDLWKQAKFTSAELANPAISGDDANPDGDALRNLLEYAMGTEPKLADTRGPPTLALANGIFNLSYTHFKAAADVSLTLEVSSNLTDWTPVPPSQAIDNGPIETLTLQEAVSTNSARFFRFKASRL